MTSEKFVDARRTTVNWLYKYRNYCSILFLFFLIIWPFLGIAYLPMADLPNHLAITRMLHDVLAGGYGDSLQINYDIQYKFSYCLLYGLFILLPKKAVAATYVATVMLIYFLSLILSLKLFSKEKQFPWILNLLAAGIAMLAYNASFFWGLLSFSLSIPFSLIAFSFYLKFLRNGTKKYVYGFLALSICAHIVHPVSSVFLGICLGGAILGWIFGGYMKALRPGLLVLLLWPVVILLVQHFSLEGGPGIIWADFLDRIRSPFHNIGEALEYVRNFINTSSMYPTKLSYDSALPYFASLLLLFIVTLSFGMCYQWRHGTDDSKEAASSVAKFFLISAIIFLLSIFIRHDLFSLRGPGLVWYEVRGSAVFSFLISFILAVSILSMFNIKMFGHRCRYVFCTILLLLMFERSLTLRSHFISFDSKVAEYLNSQDLTSIIDSQQLLLHLHLSTYDCYLPKECFDYSNLFFVHFPESKLFPLSPRDKK